VIGRPRLPRYDPPAKACAKCRVVKKAVEFPKDPRMVSGLSSYCRGCHKERTRLGSARRYVARAEWLRKQKDVPCADCGGRFPPECMDFDHVRGKKAFGIGGRVGRTPLKDLFREMAKCDVVCANCHRIRGRARGRAGWRKSA